MDAPSVEKANSLHADQRELAYVNHDGARSIVDLRFDLGQMVDVELADQLDDQGVS